MHRLVFVLRLFSVYVTLTAHFDLDQPLPQVLSRHIGLVGVISDSADLTGQKIRPKQLLESLRISGIVSLVWGHLEEKLWRTLSNVIILL